MTKQEAYEKFVLADAVWSANLIRAFGKAAGDKRYTAEGRQVDGYEEFRKACETWAR